MAPKPITTLVQGEQLTLREISERYDIEFEALRTRYYRSRDRGDDLIRPAQKLGKVKRQIMTLLEEEIPGAQIARILGCSPQIVSYYKSNYLP